DGRVLFIGVEERVIDDTANGGPSIWRVWGDTLDVLDLDTREWKQAWSTFDAFDPFPRVPDRWRHLDRVEADMPSIWEWTHANAIYFGRRGNLLLSFRHLDQVISLSPGFETVEWRLGGPDSSFTFPDPADQFYGQHTASELPNGNILLFDNGNFRPEGPYSRALELELDFGTMTARKVWEYRPQADVYAHRLSSATRLPNGNTLVNFGFRGDGPDQPPVIVEARPDGTAAWELTPRLPGVRTVSYRAYPWPTLGGELQVEPTGLTGLAAVGGR
nr:aryl-sulfate sulfotransferase [Chloroflexota bacterium]